MSETRISASISPGTKRELERQAKTLGVKKGHVLEAALLHHLQALRELPPDLIIPPRLQLTAKSFAALAKRLEKPARPTKPLRDLMRGKRVRGEPDGW